MRRMGGKLITNGAILTGEKSSSDSLDFRMAQPFPLRLQTVYFLSNGYFSLGLVLYRESCIIYQSHKS